MVCFRVEERRTVIGRLPWSQFAPPVQRCFETCCVAAIDCGVARKSSSKAGPKRRGYRIAGWDLVRVWRLPLSFA